MRVSLADTGRLIAGWSHDRICFQVKAILPCFNAGSMTSTGNTTLASVKFNCAISTRKDSGQLAISAFKGRLIGALAEGAEAGAGAAGIAAAGRGGMGITGAGLGGVGTAGAGLGAIAGIVGIACTGFTGIALGGSGLGTAGAGWRGVAAGPAAPINVRKAVSVGIFIGVTGADASAAGGVGGAAAGPAGARFWKTSGISWVAGAAAAGGVGGIAAGAFAFRFWKRSGTD